MNKERFGIAGYETELVVQVAPGQPILQSQDVHYVLLSIRLGFIRKVFGILSIQLLVTMGIVALAFNSNINRILKRSEYFASIGFAVSFVIFLIFLLCKRVRRKIPINFILLAIFTLTFGLGVSSLTTLFEAQYTLYVGGMLFCICATMTLYTLQKKFDLKWYGSLLITALTVGISFLVVYFGFPPNEIEVLYISTVATLILGIYLTLLIHSCCKANPENYILTVIVAYFLVVAIFLIALVIVACGPGAKACNSGGSGGHSAVCVFPRCCGGDVDSNDEESSIGS